MWEEGGDVTDREKELEAEIERLRLVIRTARQRLYDAHGRSPAEQHRVVLAVSGILRDDSTPPAASPRWPSPPPVPLSPSYRE